RGAALVSAAEPMARAVVDVVHPHESRRRASVLEDRVIDVRPRIGEHRIPETSVPGVEGAGGRDSPTAPLVEGAFGEHGLQVELEILRRLGQLRANSIDRFHLDVSFPNVLAASWPTRTSMASAASIPPRPPRLPRGSAVVRIVSRLSSQAPPGAIGPARRDPARAVAARETFPTLDLERRIALLPVAGAELVRLETVEHSERLRDRTADREVVDVHPADDAVRIGDEGRAESDPRL